MRLFSQAAAYHFPKGECAMRRTVSKILDISEGNYLPALILIAVCFFLSGTFGCLLASYIDGGGREQLSVYVDGFLRSTIADGSELPGLAVQIWDVIRWPILTVLLGFTALGLLGLPLLFAVRGFLLGFSISSFVQLFGSSGCLLAFLLFGMSSTISVPVLFVLGVQSFTTARKLAGCVGQGRKALLPCGRTYIRRYGICALALCICVVLERVAVPPLVSGLAQTFLC